MSFSLNSIDKQQLLQRLRDLVAQDLEALVRRQRDVQAGATHAENRAEHAKDTRSTEQSYLARGLAKRVHEMQIIADALESLTCRNFDAEDGVGITALVRLYEFSTPTPRIWWLVPGAASVEIEQGDARIRTLTPASPLGRALLGLCVGDEGTCPSPTGKRHFEILEIA